LDGTPPGGRVRFSSEPEEAGIAVLEASAPIAMAARGVSDARRRAVRWAQGWRAPVDADVLSLLVSELATNAVIHGAPPASMRAVWDRGVLRVEVTDAGVGSVPTPVAAAPEEPSGRGIALVEALSDGWGVDLRTDATVVWFEIRA
jgi:anti-sigma regulatory factor (Ser/Thr protein kinase)